ncbi:MAG: hypothetical protein LBC09_02245 [Helicobacteraceae bacterium]|nr:hypothetical protein [Helicobacteraceae bacterium]
MPLVFANIFDQGLASLNRFLSALFAAMLAFGGAAYAEITAIAAGDKFSVALDSDGKLYATGRIGYGRLEPHDANIYRGWYKFSAIEPFGGAKITAITVGDGHALALTSDGRVYGTGRNKNGELGLDDLERINNFTEVLSLKSKTVSAVAAGYRHSLALSAGGKVYAAGDNYRGQLGINDIDNPIKSRKVFTEALGDIDGKKIIAASAGRDYSLALDEGGRVYGAGGGYHGELGLNQPDRKFRAFTEISTLKDKKIIAIAAGVSHSLALSAGGKIYAAGHNGYGQLGLGDTTDRAVFTEVATFSGKDKIIAVAAGYQHSLALSAGGKVYAAGRNYMGQFGLGDTTDRAVFTEIPTLKDKKIIAVAAGGFHSLALDSDGRIYATGMNNNGQLGLGDSKDRDTFTLVPLSL